MTIVIESFFDPETSTITHVVSDSDTQMSAVIDSVLDYDQFSGQTSTRSADAVIEYIKSKNFRLQWILDTHIHADHLTASKYIKSKLGGQIGIGSRIKEVLRTWVPIFNTSFDTSLEASQFDRLFEDQDIFLLGSVPVKAIHTPGHTPACVAYLIEDALFAGDTLFMPDVGTARTDFPGGNADQQFDSLQKILELPDQTRIFLCHDYPPQGREAAFMTTVKDQKTNNILIGNGVTKQTYVETRTKRDLGKPVPKLLYPSIQVNLRAGDFGSSESNGTHYIKIPVRIDS